MYHWSWMFLIPGIEDGSALPGVTGEAAHSAYIVPSSWLVFLIIAGIAFMANRQLAAVRAKGGTLQYVPSERLSARGVMELLTEGLMNLSESVFNSRKAALTYLPLVGTIFAYILISNLMGLIPGFLPPTADLNTNLAMSIIVFVVFNVAGVMVNGMGYFKHMAGPILILAPLIFTLELIGVLFRPVSLAIRLFGNMNGDHAVFGIFSDLVPIGVPSVFLGLGLFVCFVQAFVFSLLTVVYVALSIAHDEDDHH